ncbi:MAG: hypothetical protein RJA25_2228, partial [Bacteroidota bacterium]
MSKQIKTLRDHNGFDVPVTAIGKIDLKKNQTAIKIAEKFKEMAVRLQNLKDFAFDAADEIYELQLKAYEIDGRDVERMKGNFTFFSYDKRFKVEVNIGQRLEFDDKINLAKAEIDEYLKEITEGQNSDILIIVNNAFTTVRGKLDPKRILQLFSYQIKNVRWKKAMEILQDSITTNYSKRYIKVSERDSNGEYQNINVQ